ncbi:: Peptidase_U35 [Gemmataceae bacterium]|nr:: Peptidase_U35 [Gemmataceae bacterium]VTU02444.1 : Peptidase_U35 [Gemmataceae bacterium]
MPPTPPPRPPAAPAARNPGGWVYTFGAVVGPGIRLAAADRAKLPRWWTWTPGAFREALAEAAAGTRDVQLLVDHDWDGRPLAGTRDGSLSLWANRWGVKWRLNAGTRRGAAALAWLKAHPDFRGVSMGGTATGYRVRAAGQTRYAEVTAFSMFELSLVRQPGYRAGFFTAAGRRPPLTTNRGPTMPPTAHTDEYVMRAVRAVAAAERGRIQGSHVPPEAFAAAVAAGLLAKRAGGRGHAITAKGRARLGAANGAGTLAGAVGRPPALRT